MNKIKFLKICLYLVPSILACLFIFDLVGFGFFNLVPEKKAFFLVTYLLKFILTLDSSVGGFFNQYETFREAVLTEITFGESNFWSGFFINWSGEILFFNTIYSTLIYTFIAVHVKMLIGEYTLHWLYFGASLIYFLLAIFFKNIIKNKEFRGGEDKLMEFNLSFIRYFCNSWLVCNIFFIFFYVFQFDLMSTAVYAAETLNNFGFFLCFFKIFLLIAYSMFLIIFRDIVMRKDHIDESKIKYFRVEFLLLTGYLVFGSLALLNGSSLIEVFLTLEIQSYCLYILAGSDRTSLLSMEAGLKYFIFGSLSSLIGLFGIAILYLETGFFDFGNILLFIKGDTEFNFCALGIILFLCNFFFKIGLFPFHFWMPDVFHGSHLLYTIFFATVSKIAPFGYFVFLCGLFLPELPNVSYLIFIVCNFSILVGSISAFGQKSIKKLIGYSSIGNIGFCLVFLASDFASAFSIGIITLYFVIYIITIIGFFSVITCFQISSKTDIFFIDDFDQLPGIFEKNPSNKAFFNLRYLSLVIFFCIFLFSFAGIPPFLGFFSKFFVFFGFIESGFVLDSTYSLSLFLYLYFLLSQVILMAFYYLRLIKYVIFLSDLPEDETFGKNIFVSIYSKGSKLLILQITFLGLISLFGIFLFSPLYNAIIVCIL